MQSGELWGSFLVRGKTAVYPVRMQLPGTFNVYNALAAIRAAGHLGAAESDICLALRSAKVPGRCENVRRSEDYVILIDYAHNEMSLKIFWKCCAGLSRGVLSYCSVRRQPVEAQAVEDGETAGHLADLTILTSDNPRWEDPEEILDDIEDGIRGTGGQYVRIADRRKPCGMPWRKPWRMTCLCLRERGTRHIRRFAACAIRSVNTSWWRKRDEAPDMGENTDRNEVDRWRNMRR